jgi:hypothetical protein
MDKNFLKINIGEIDYNEVKPLIFSNFGILKMAQDLQEQLMPTDNVTINPEEALLSKVAEIMGYQYSDDMSKKTLQNLKVWSDTYSPENIQEGISTLTNLIRDISSMPEMNETSEARMSIESAINSLQNFSNLFITFVEAKEQAAAFISQNQ